MSDLVERVAQAMYEADDYYVSKDQARAAIAVLRPALRAAALLDAAKVADEWTAYDAGAAIRAMILKEDT